VERKAFEHYKFARQLSQLAFVRLRGCEAPERVELGALGTSG
jgi:hypothetical protein